MEKYISALAVGVVGLRAASVYPPLGPGRALWIALRTRFARRPAPESMRVAELELLKNHLENDLRGSIVVTGPMGVGKTCLISSATSKVPGVITVNVNAGDAEYRIVTETLQSLTRLSRFHLFPSDAAKRVVFWHRFFFGRSPTVVIYSFDPAIGRRCGEVANAARTLTEVYNLRVIVDGTQNWIEGVRSHSNRPDVIELEPMTKDMIWRVDELRDFLRYVDEAGMGDTVYAVLGGIPASFNALRAASERGLQKGQDVREAIGRHLCDKIFAAIETVLNQLGDHSDAAAITKLMDKTTKSIRCDLLVANKLHRSTPDKVFRATRQNGAAVLVPASNAIGIVLQHSLVKTPTLIELEELLEAGR